MENESGRTTFTVLVMIMTETLVEYYMITTARLFTSAFKKVWMQKQKTTFIFTFWWVGVESNRIMGNHGFEFGHILYSTSWCF